jgi:hypothetical protein
VLRHSFASLAADLGYNEPTIATLLGHKAHSITSRYVHSADAALLAAADAVANATTKLMASDESQASCGIRVEADQPCGTNSPYYRCFRPTGDRQHHRRSWCRHCSVDFSLPGGQQMSRIGTSHWSQRSLRSVLPQAC